MINKNTKKFAKHEILYVIDWWSATKGTEAIITNGIIKNVNETLKTLTIGLISGELRLYSFDDYNRLIFDDKAKAKEELNKIPLPTSIIYKVKNNKTYEKKVYGITYIMKDNLTDLALLLENGELISIKEIGVTIFLDKKHT